jgi:hypothetical protein
VHRPGRGREQGRYAVHLGIADHRPAPSPSAQARCARKTSAPV